MTKRESEELKTKSELSAHQKEIIIRSMIDTKYPTFPKSWISDINIALLADKVKPGMTAQETEDLEGAIDLLIRYEGTRPTAGVEDRSDDGTFEKCLSDYDKCTVAKKEMFGQPIVVSEEDIAKAKKRLLREQLTPKKSQDNLAEQIQLNQKITETMNQVDTSLKLKWSLMPFESLEEILKVIQHGADKFEPWDWVDNQSETQNFDAAMRHLAAYKKGEQRETESGLLHLAHACARLVFIVYKLKKMGV